MTGPRILKRRPTTVEAWRVTTEDGPDIARWCGGVWSSLSLRVLMLTGYDDWAHADAGDWVIRGPFGNFYPSPDNLMAANYEAVISVVSE